MPHASFMKFTGHQFLGELRNTDEQLLESFKVDRNSRKRQFWQRNALPIRLYNRKILEQKLNYIHLYFPPSTSLINLITPSINAF